MPNPHNTMPFRFGPNSWCTDKHAEEMGYTRYVPKPGEDEALAAAHKAAKAATLAAYRASQSKSNDGRPVPVSLPPATKAPAFDALPPAPERYPVHPHQRSKAELQGELSALDEWLTKTASLYLSRKDVARREIAQDRADELYSLAAMAR